MKYTSEIKIDLPREQVIALFDNTENTYKWMDGLQSVEHLEGEPGEEGARSKMRFEMGKRRIEMVETILQRDFPDRFKTAYDTAGVYNEVDNQFIDQGEATLYRTVHYFRFEGWGMRMMAFLMPGAFKKQSMTYLKNFKAFAEQADV